MAGVAPADRPADRPAPAAARPLTPAQRLRREHGGEGVGAVVPWLLVSLALHVGVFLVLWMFTFGSVPVRREVIRIDTDLREIFESEEPVQRYVTLDPTKTVSDAERRQALLRSLERAGTAAEGTMEVDAVDLGGLEADLSLEGGPASGGRPSAGDLARRVRRRGEAGMREVLDEIARHILDVVDRRTLLVVILFDMSRSLEETRRLFTAQLGRTFQDVNLSITDAQEKRLKWCVVGFGREVRPRQAPTRDLERIQRAIGSLPWDRTGEENVAAALRYCARHLSGVAERTMVILVTDEEGDDLGVHEGEGPIETIPEVGKLLRDHRTLLFVLGQETLVGSRGVRYQPKGAQTWGILERGLPTRRTEVLGGGGIWSGYGAYSLAALARQTRGALFLISERKMRYEPKVLAAYGGL